MSTMLFSVLVASLFGSAHCAGMCGGLAAFCGGAGQCFGRESSIASCVYHGSRFIAYMCVGACAGGFGVLLNSGGALVGVQHMAAIAAGMTVAIVGIGMLLQSIGIDFGRAPFPTWMSDWIHSILKAAATWRPIQRAFFIGLATPLLPCGWLWAFSTVAAGTGHVLDGALVMTIFWAGTVPILALVGAGIAAVGGRWRRVVAAMAGVVMIAVGVHTAATRASLAEPVSIRLSQRSLHTNQSNGTKARSSDDALEGSSIANMANEPPACCVEKISP